MSDLTQRYVAAKATDNGWTKNAAASAHQDSATRECSGEQAVATARWAVAEYLRDVGLRDPELIATESQRMVARTQRALAFRDTVNEPSLSEAAIQLTVKQLDRWLLALAADSCDPGEPRQLGSVVGARLPDLLSRYPEAWKQPRPSAELVESMRGDLIPVVPQPRPRSMCRQSLVLVPASLKRLGCKIAGLFGRKLELGSDEPSADCPNVAFSPRKTPMRVALAFLTIVSNAYGTWLFSRVLAADGFDVIDFALVMLFAVLFGWVVFSFWIATLGLVVILRRSRRGLHAQRAVSTPTDLPPTAIVMPVHNEEPRKVFANIRAIAQSLQAIGGDAAFGIFVLSDTTDPDVWLEEERAWAKLVVELPAQCRVFYRHRPKNVSRKAGNIADFCSRWGEHYKYMIVLDADSVMAGETLVEMVLRMERDPRIGILQAPPRPINRQSFFARMQQFAAHVYGPVFLEGFVLWSGCDGNYWGHNAIIRIRPFMEHCELPILPGDGPLGGEILSHDFVEAALMRRAGWKVCLAHDLDGSYEECPTTIRDFAQRDQRWCQGNLQHIRLLLAEGLHPASRLHFGMGAMSYLASPLWLAFLVLTAIHVFYAGDLSATGSRASSGAVLFATTMSLLLLPKVWSVIAMARHHHSPAGSLRDRALASVLLESVISMLVAPIMMLLHTRFVVATLLGRRVKWGAQQRDDCGVSLRAAFAMHYSHTLSGLAIGGIAWHWAPGLLPWLSPVLFGLVLSIPLAMLLGSIHIGKSLGHRGLLTIPEEVVPPPVLKYQRDALADTTPEIKSTSDRTDVFVSVIRDPTFYALHVGVLRATQGQVPISPRQRQQIEQLLRNGAVATAPTEVRRAVLNDWRTMEKLHILVRSHLPPAHSALLT